MGTAAFGVGGLAAREGSRRWCQIGAGGVVDGRGEFGVWKGSGGEVVVGRRMGRWVMLGLVMIERREFLVPILLFLFVLSLEW